MFNLHLQASCADLVSKWGQNNIKQQNRPFAMFVPQLYLVSNVLFSDTKALAALARIEPSTCAMLGEAKVLSMLSTPRVVSQHDSVAAVLSTMLHICALPTKNFVVLKHHGSTT